jgi:hypothetical protein
MPKPDLPKKMHEQHVFLSLNKAGVEAPCTSLDELMFDYLAFDAAGAAGTAPGGRSGEQAYFACIYVVLHLLHHLLECLGFTWCILIAVPMLCPFHNMVFARTRLVVVACSRPVVEAPHQ